MFEKFCFGIISDSLNTLTELNNNLSSLIDERFTETPEQRFERMAIDYYHENCCIKECSGHGQYDYIPKDGTQDFDDFLVFYRKYIYQRGQFK